MVPWRETEILAAKVLRWLCQADDVEFQLLP